MSNTFAHDSFFGGLNLYKRRDQRYGRGAGERPPYPIIVDQPTFGEAVKNFNRADWGLMFMFTAIGFPMARVATRGSFASEYQRRKLFNAFWWIMISSGFITALANSGYRLQGHVDNGLRWKRPEIKLNKYDFTKEYEKKYFWLRALRIRD
mmetsp:Transcript_11722/g.13514  ORF Transcript_11722/g.13514 Transcript_11722/m.13514 type:complete len:151 (+) Transcript_11722:42-494(+)